MCRFIEDILQGNEASLYSRAHNYLTAHTNRKDILNGFEKDFNLNEDKIGVCEYYLEKIGCFYRQKVC